jgi:predicted transcriptional regulator
MYTTVRVEQKTKEKLNEIKNYDREPLDSVIERLIENISNDEITDDEIAQIGAGLKDIKEGKYKTIEEAEKEWGI